MVVTALLGVVTGCAPPPATPATVRLSRIVAHQECRGGDAVACFALAYDYRTGGEAANEQRATEAGKDLLGAKKSGRRSRARGSETADHVEVAAPKKADRRSEAKQAEADREQKAYEAWVANPVPPLAEDIDSVVMAETFGLDSRFYREHGIRQVSLRSLQTATARTMLGVYGFVLMEQYATLLNKLNKDLVAARRRFSEWADKSGLALSPAARQEQERLSIRWAEQINHHRQDLASEMKR